MQIIFCWVGLHKIKEIVKTLTVDDDDEEEDEGDDEEDDEEDDDDFTDEDLMEELEGM